MTTFQRNAIIAGYINSYCLVCECFFETEEQTFSHIGGDEHETRKLIYPYLEKYGNNCIRKVKAGYFCEYCSLIMATAAKVNLHIAEKLHYYNKGNSLLMKSGSALTAFNDVLISESAWHSFSEDVCTLCDTEFDDGDEHKVERSHVLKLLQNKVQFAENNNLYRMIDKNNFQCLTCNCVPTESTLDEHFNEKNHKEKYIQCQEEKKKFDIMNPKEEKVIKAKTKTELKVEEKAADSNNVALNNIEPVTGKAVIINAEQTKTNASLTPNHQTKNDTKKTDKPKIKKEEPTDPATFAVDNNLLYNPHNPNAYCKFCEKKFPSTLFGMKEHIQGRDHTNKIAKATASKPAPKKMKFYKQTMENFIQNVHTFDNTLDNDTVINGTICVPEKSCHTLSKTKCKFSDYKCQICQMSLSEDDLDDHCQTVKHSKGMLLTEVVMGLNNELIREIHPDTFHCGYCNVVMANWTATEKHLKSSEHKTSTDTCNRRLQIHLPMIKGLFSDNKMTAAFRDFINNFHHH